jgi:hypothetical protein
MGLSTAPQLRFLKRQGVKAAQKIAAGAEEAPDAAAPPAGVHFNAVACAEAWLAQHANAASISLVSDGCA